MGMGYQPLGLAAGQRLCLCLCLCLWLLAGTAQAQPAATVSPSRAEMSMEWVPSARPVLKSAPPTAPVSPNPSEATRAQQALVPAEGLPSKVWTIDLADKRLSPALQRWAGAAGWLLVWEADRDFLLDASLSIEGDFLHAIDVTMRALADTDYPLQASANPFTRVLRIARYQPTGRR
jgi:hypothetical protein